MDGVPKPDEGIGQLLELRQQAIKAITDKNRCRFKLEDLNRRIDSEPSPAERGRLRSEREILQKAYDSLIDGYLSLKALTLAAEREVRIASLRKRYGRLSLSEEAVFEATVAELDPIARTPRLEALETGAARNMALHLHHQLESLSENVADEAERAEFRRLSDLAGTIASEIPVQAPPDDAKTQEIFRKLEELRKPPPT